MPSESATAWSASQLWRRHRDFLAELPLSAEFAAPYVAGSAGDEQPMKADRPRRTAQMVTLGQRTVHMPIPSRRRASSSTMKGGAVLADRAYQDDEELHSWSWKAYADGRPDGAALGDDRCGAPRRSTVPVATPARHPRCGFRQTLAWRSRTERNSRVRGGSSGRSRKIGSAGTFRAEHRRPWATSFVPMDFERDSLDALLSGRDTIARRRPAGSGKGVVMYLTRDAMRATVAADRRQRSAAGFDADRELSFGASWVHWPARSSG